MSSATLRLVCVHCGATVEAGHDSAGKLARCGKCLGVVTVPRGDGKFHQPPGLPVVINQVPAVSRNPLTTSRGKQVAIGLALGIALPAILLFCPSTPPTPASNAPPPRVPTIREQFFADAIERYEIAKRSGSAIDAYTQASLIAASYLEVKDEVNYEKWRKIQAHEGFRAGLPAGMR